MAVEYLPQPSRDWAGEAQHAAKVALLARAKNAVLSTAIDYLNGQVSRDDLAAAVREAESIQKVVNEYGSNK